MNMGSKQGKSSSEKSEKIPKEGKICRLPIGIRGLVL